MKPAIAADRNATDYVQMPGGPWMPIARKCGACLAQDACYGVPPLWWCSVCWQLR